MGRTPTACAVGYYLPSAVRRTPLNDLVGGLPHVVTASVPHASSHFVIASGLQGFPPVVIASPPPPYGGRLKASRPQQTLP